MKQEEYNKLFETDNAHSRKLKCAFMQVSDIRKFEIELYWKRATYFWALIAVAFAGYFAVLSSGGMENKFFLSLIISNIGFIFTFAWFLSSRGSKYWQENWENHLDLLEDSVTGPLYKTLLERPCHDNLVERMITGPLSVSVSKINQFVSVFVIFSWIALICYSWRKSFKNISVIDGPFLFVVSHFAIVIVSIFFCAMMFGFGKTHKEKHMPRAILRETEIIDK